jgi:hypothetical protein
MELNNLNWSSKERDRERERARTQVYIIIKKCLMYGEGVIEVMVVKINKRFRAV